FLDMPLRRPNFEAERRHSIPLSWEEELEEGLFTFRDTKTSGQHASHHIPMHVRQAEIAAIEAIRQLRVVQSEQVQDRRLKVVDADAIVNRLVAEIVRASMMNAALDSPAGHPDGVSVWVVIAALRVL